MSSISQEVTQAKPVSVAWLLGASDAEAGEMCLPELFYVRREHMLAYTEGHESVAGETLLSRQMKDICAGNIHRSAE